MNRSIHRCVALVLAAVTAVVSLGGPATADVLCFDSNGHAAVESPVQREACCHDARAELPGHDGTGLGAAPSGCCVDIPVCNDPTILGAGAGSAGFFGLSLFALPPLSGGSPWAGTPDRFAQGLGNSPRACSQRAQLRTVVILV